MEATHPMARLYVYATMAIKNTTAINGKQNILLNKQSTENNTKNINGLERRQWSLELARTLVLLGSIERKVRNNERTESKTKARAVFLVCRSSLRNNTRSLFIVVPWKP